MHYFNFEGNPIFVAQTANQAASRPDELPVTVAFHEMALMVSRLFNDQVRDLGLTRSQWQLLYSLYRQDGQTQTELAEVLSMAKPPLGKIVDRLQEDGWVTRKEDAQDRRAKRVFLTDRVYPLIQPLERVVLEIGETAMAGLSERDRKALNSLLGRVHTNLTAAVSLERS